MLLKAPFLNEQTQSYKYPKNIQKPKLGHLFLEPKLLIKLTENFIGYKNTAYSTETGLFQFFQRFSWCSNQYQGPGIEETSTLYFKITIKWNLTKAYVTRLKWIKQ